MNRFPQNFLSITLLLAVLFVCSIGCSTGQKEDRQQYKKPEPLAMVLKHRADSASQDIASQVTHTLDYASIPYTTYDLSLGTSQLQIPEQIKLLYLTTDRVEQLQDQEVRQLVTFVAKGNQLVILTPLYDERFAYLMGMKAQSDQQIDRQAEGFHFKEHVFPDFKGEGFRNRATFLHNGFAGSTFIKDKSVIATAANDPDYPVIVERSIGEGRSIYFNTSVLVEKDYRGLLFSVGLKELEGLPYRVANTSTIFLDDFPAPLYDSKLPPIDQEYDTTHANFVTKIWWPEMKALADRFNIDYTAMLTFNYNAVVVPPFDFKEWEDSRLSIQGRNRNGSVWIAQDIKDSRHELGFHGYNHFSLWRQDWQNMQFMQSSLQAAKKRWRISSLGSFPVTYVPPTNNIDSLGLAAITKTMPSIEYMSSLYLSSVEDGGGREFEPDPLAPSMFDYPRITSGYVNNEISNFNQHSLFLYSGIWTHFIHPDDVFQVTQRSDDEYRSRNPLGLGWHSSPDHDYGLYEVFVQRLEETLQRYPITRFLTVRESAPIVQNWVNTQSYYKFGESQLSVTTRLKNSKQNVNDHQYWFAYVGSGNQKLMENGLKVANIEFSKSPLWDGALYQFKTTSDTLNLPLLDQQEPAGKAVIAQALDRYRAFMNPPDNVEESQSNWEDTRLKDALAALSNHPNSQVHQEKVIEMAVEFDSVNVAISILERRLMNNTSWDSNDAERLLKFYGWEDASQHAYDFAEKLWTKHHNELVLRFEDKLTAQFGTPSTSYQERWLRREYELNPNNFAILRQLAENAESWEQREQYLKELIAANPRSDSLYAYAIHQSIDNAENLQTIELLQSFPDSQYVDQQLRPYAAQIAYRYADQNELTRAGIWAQKTDQIPKTTELSWLLQQQRYHDFLERSEQYINQDPQNDSLRTFVGQQMMYENYRQQGYQVLYPLFEQDNASEQTQKLVHTEIGYMGYQEQKSFYREYPAFFSDSLRQSIQTKYRLYEGFKTGAISAITSDNFNSQTAEIGLFAEWGNRQDATHRVTLSEQVVSSDLIGGSNLDNLYHLDYRYQQTYQEPSRQLTLGGGGYILDQSFRPGVHAEYWISKDSTYTSGQLEFSPVFTNTALNQDISKVQGQLYREDYWLNGGIQTALSLRGTWFSDSNFSYEALSRFFVNWPVSTGKRKIRPLIDFSYADAQTTYSSGNPYYTPDALFVQGIGVDLSYQDAQNDPDFSAGVELMAKRDSRDGAFFVGAGRLNAQISNFWQLSLNGYFSTSRVYRYNSINLSVSYIFQRNLRP